MRKILIFIFLFFITSNSFSGEFKNCSKQEMDFVWSNLSNNKGYNDKERFCLAKKTILFLEEVFIRDISPLTPREQEWVIGEYNYLSKTNPNQQRINEFLNHTLRHKHDLFRVVSNTKDNLNVIMRAIESSDKKLEIKYWAITVSYLVSHDIWEYYHLLVKRNVVTQNPLAGGWTNIHLPRLLYKGIVFN